MYIYPDNLKAKATMWLWELKDLAVIGILVLISVFGFAYAKLWFPLIFAGISYHTGGGHFHFEIYPVCLRLFFSGTAKF